MDSTTTTTAKPVCAQEALALLNCAAESSYDRDKCLALLDALRACIAQKKVKKFSLADTSPTGTSETPKSK
uniref:CHCH domain-containing protein n=1 Tax=Oryza brachyantha TaxID=4533 RepID=J3KXU7_ORYBR